MKNLTVKLTQNVKDIKKKKIAKTYSWFPGKNVHYSRSVGVWGLVKQGKEKGINY